MEDGLAVVVTIVVEIMAVLLVGVVIDVCVEFVRAAVVVTWFAIVVVVVVRAWLFKTVIVTLPVIQVVTKSTSHAINLFGKFLQNLCLHIAVKLTIYGFLLKRRDHGSYVSLSPYLFRFLSYSLKCNVWFETNNTNLNTLNLLALIGQMKPRPRMIMSGWVEQWITCCKSSVLANYLVFTKRDKPVLINWQLWSTFHSNWIVATRWMQTRLCQSYH